MKIVILLTLLSSTAFAVPFVPESIKAEAKPTGDPNVYLVEYADKKVFMDCSKRAPRMAIARVYKQEAYSDMTSSNIFYERELPTKCQPTASLATGINYSTMFDEARYSKHLNAKLIPEPATGLVDGLRYEIDPVSDSITNHFPALKEFYYGPLINYNKYIQCLRANTSFTLINGLIYGDNNSYKSTYGIDTPDFMWSVILLPNGLSQTYLFSNSPTRGREMNMNIERYVVSINELETTLGYKLPVGDRRNRNTVTPKLQINMKSPACSSE